MPVDASIPLSVALQKPQDSLEQFGKALTLSDAMRQREDTTALRDILASHDFTTLEGRQKAYPALMRANPEMGFKLQQQDRDYQLSRMKQKLEIMGGQAAFIHNRYMDLKAQGLSDQSARAAVNEDYKRGLAALTAQRYEDGSPMFAQEEIAGIPQEFDPAVVGQTLAQLVPAKQQLEMAESRRKMALDERKQSEAERHNRAIERNQTGTSRLVAMPDPNSPTGFAYGVPSPGAPAAAPRANVAPNRLPPTLQKEEDADLEIVNAASGMKTDLGSIRDQIDRGELNLGLLENAASRARNAVGRSSENSRNFASLQSTLERLRNESLRLNKGVQTEGDAVRAWNELMTNIRDEELVKQRLDEIQRLNDRAIELRRGLIENRRKSYNSQAPDASQFEARDATVGANKTNKKYVRTGTRNGKRVGQLPDGTIEEIPGG